MLNIKSIKPIGCQILVTEEIYGYDDYNAGGIIEAGHKKGDLKSHQTVIAVGDDVRFVKPGDVVEINFYKYCSFENNPNSVKVNGTNKVLELHLNEVDLVDEKGEPVYSFLIDERDVKYIIKDFEEVTYDKKDAVIAAPKASKLILPNHRIKV